MTARKIAPLPVAQEHTKLNTGGFGQRATVASIKVAPPPFGREDLSALVNRSHRTAGVISWVALLTSKFLVNHFNMRTGRTFKRRTARTSTQVFVIWSTCTFLVNQSLGGLVGRHTACPFRASNNWLCFCKLLGILAARHHVFRCAPPSLSGRNRLY